MLFVARSFNKSQNAVKFYALVMIIVSIHFFYYLGGITLRLGLFSYKFVKYSANQGPFIRGSGTIPVFMTLLDEICYYIEGKSFSKNSNEIW